MIDLILIQEIVEVLKPSYPDVYIGGQHESTPITLPAVLIDMRSDGVVGGPLFRGTLNVQVTSQADDQTNDQHAALVDSVSESIKAIYGVLGDTDVAGVVYVSCDTAREERHFTSTVQFVIGYHKTGVTI